MAFFNLTKCLTEDLTRIRRRYFEQRETCFLCLAPWLRRVVEPSKQGVFQGPFKKQADLDLKVDGSSQPGYGGFLAKGLLFELKQQAVLYFFARIQANCHAPDR